MTTTDLKLNDGLAASRIVGTWMSLILLLGSLGCFGGPRVDLRPTVKELRETLKTLRVSDYEAGRVRFSDNEKANRMLLDETIALIREAEANAKKALELANKGK